MKQDMHESINEHINHDKGHNTGHDKGYNVGYQDGVKRAWDLVGELAARYKQAISTGHLMDEEDAGKASGRYEAALYAQMVIKKDSI